MKKNNFIYARYDKEDNCLGVYDTMEEAIWKVVYHIDKTNKKAIIKPIIIFGILHLLAIIYIHFHFWKL